MESVNNRERQLELNHKQKHTTDSRNCHSSWTRKDSGNGSSEMNDEEFLQNGGTDTHHSSSENELSGDDKMNNKQNTSSSSVACNGIEQEMISVKSDSSNCSSSSSGDTIVNHTHSRVEDSQNMNVNHSHFPEEENQDMKINHSHFPEEENQDMKMNHSHLAVKDSQGIIMNHPHVPEEHNDNEIIQPLAYQLHDKAASSELHKFCGDSSISAAGLHQDNIPRCLSVPSSSATMSHQPPEFLSLPVSPVDLVPKHIMDNLGRELFRERDKVKMLEEENYQLITKVNKLEGMSKQNNVRINHYVNQLTLQTQKVSLLQKLQSSWQVKCNVKDKELSTAHQNLNALSITCKQLEDQIAILNSSLCVEKSENKTLNDNYRNLERTIQKERVRFDRDDKYLKEKIKKLEAINQWLSEEVAAHEQYPMSVPATNRRDFSASRRSHTEIESNSRSHETPLKGVYPENNVCQTIMTVLKQKPKKCDYETQEPCHASPKMKCMKASGQENILPGVEKCSYCYKEASEFKSSKEYMDHIDKCGQ